MDYAGVIESYIAALHTDRVDTTGTTPFIKEGRKATKSNPSKFINGPMGKNTLYKVGEHIADFLGLPEPKKYTGHTFRLAAATKAADEGATTMEMRGIFGWNSDKMPSVYVANSIAKMNKQAKMLCGVDVNQNESCRKSEDLCINNEKSFEKMDEKCRKRENETETNEEPVKKAQKIEATSTSEPKNPNQGVISNQMENCQITINYNYLSKSE